jgi:alpha-L-arabinofuranosidase
MRFHPERKRATRRRFAPQGLEILEARALLATVTVNASQVVQPVNTQLSGVNIGTWDQNLNTTQTNNMVLAAGLTSFRFPGGGWGDYLHINESLTSQLGDSAQPWQSYGSMAQFIASVHGQGIVTLDYGSGSPQEAAALLSYLDAPTTSNVQIGYGEQWSNLYGSSTTSWVQVNFQNSGYWASLRAATPITPDDGLNFLRIGRAAPFGLQYFEVGNEEYGSWETDNHGQGGDTGKPHDPATYIAFAAQFASYAAAIDPSISIGLDVGSPGDYNNWTADILQQSAALGFMPGFLSDHNYVQTPGSESDSNLLLDTVSDPSSDPSDPGNPYDWAVRAADYESLIAQYLGPAGENVQLLATEFNSVNADAGKQTTSLVNGLFVADSLGALLETPYVGANIWDLRSGWYTGGNNSSSLYGWRQGGDYGLLGDPSGSAPATGTYVPYPTYFAEQLASKIIQAGGEVVQASSSDPNLAVYAVLEPTGHLDLLVINKSASGALTGQFDLTDYTPPSLAQVWQYGEAQDTAQSQTTDGHSALADFTAALNPSGSTFSYSFPAYSMTVLDLGKVVSIATGPSITQAAAASPSPVTGMTTVLSVSATDPAGASSLTYTWTSTGSPPAPVSFSANGTNAAQDVTATFSRSGVYSFQVTVSDPGGAVATSSVTVNVDPTLTTIQVSPAASALPAGGQEAFTAAAYDQFGDLISTGPAISWSVMQGVGTIDATSGLYTAPQVGGTEIIQASSGGIAGTATITISSPPTVITSPPARFGATVAFSVLPPRKKKRFQADVTITNTGTATIDNWTLQFQFKPRITSIQDAILVSHSHGHDVIENAGDNSTIGPGQSVTFGIVGRAGRVPAAPTNDVLNGIAIGGTTLASVAAPRRSRKAENRLRAVEAGPPTPVVHSRMTMRGRYLDRRWSVS